jgi:polar amino acid transport system substrate-binding protein
MGAFLARAAVRTREAVTAPRTCGVALALVAALALPACVGDRAAGLSFEPVHPGVLTVATAFLPAPGFWEGSPRAPSGGFEDGLAHALADRLGLDRVEVVQVPFSQIAAGDLGGADLALTQMTPTDEREGSVDFTTPYLTASPGILARAGVDAADLDELQELRWVVARVSTLTPIVEERVRPDEEPIVVEDRSRALDVIRSGRADVLLLDLPVAQGLAREQPATFGVLGQLGGGEGLAAVLPDGSRNLEIVDSAIRALASDGTIDDLVSRWLGESSDDVPLIRTGD